MSTIRYVGHGAEIEDDLVRLRRRKFESAHDAARRLHQSKPRHRRKAPGPARAWPTVAARGR